jgi:Holliday junction resolvase RusA-like endonuclease
MIRFSVKIEPRGKGRPRATVRGNHASVYTDGKTRKYEAAVRAVAVRSMAGGAPLAGPIEVVLRFRIPIPVSYSNKRRAAILAGQEPYFGAFDSDNLAKAWLDACNGVVFADDKQVTDLVVIRRPSMKPGIDACVTPVTPEALAETQGPAA